MGLSSEFTVARTVKSRLQSSENKDLSLSYTFPRNVAYNRH